ncbi:hypothetical protein BDW59DRAFT_145898 [Aspergillus cavernicola]|uniref:Uncharacterized protein n=1 Tax=Aspergillus cavernicola TaxID=176166 RepID=A0ABR4IFU7_9EURO
MVVERQMKRANRGKLHEISFPIGKERLVKLEPRNERMSEGVLSSDRGPWYQ